MENPYHKNAARENPEKNNELQTFEQKKSQKTEDEIVKPHRQRNA